MIIREIAKKVGVPEHKIMALANSATYRYKDFQILKKDKSSFRSVSQPAKQIKALQRLFVDEFFSKFPVHEAATAYKKGANIQINAHRHLNNRYLLKLDFKNFFPSITYNTIGRFLDTQLLYPLNLLDKLTICNLVCRNGGLVIGAPSSPAVSNVIMYNFDRLLSEKLFKLAVTYTRYADDLTFSTNTPDVLVDCIDLVNSTLKEVDLRLAINPDKTVFTSKKRLRKVTGVIITSEDKLSVGRERKRKIKSLFFRLLNENLTIEQVQSLQGEIAYVLSVEPSFVDSLKKKYGTEYDRGITILKKIYESA